MDSTHDACQYLNLWYLLHLCHALESNAYTPMTPVQMMALIIYVDKATFGWHPWHLYQAHVSTDVLDDKIANNGTHLLCQSMATFVFCKVDFSTCDNA